jgi:hypothetical protein
MTPLTILLWLVIAWIAVGVTLNAGIGVLLWGLDRTPRPPVPTRPDEAVPRLVRHERSCMARGCTDIATHHVVVRHCITGTFCERHAREHASRLSHRQGRPPVELIPVTGG